MMAATESAQQIDAGAWANWQRTAHPSEHYVLVAFARAVMPGTYVAALGVAAISDAIGLDRKMITRSLVRLTERGLVTVETKGARAKLRRAYHLAVLGIG